MVGIASLIHRQVTESTPGNSGGQGLGEPKFMGPVQ